MANDMEQHERGERIEAQHGCPECGIGIPQNGLIVVRSGCRWCHGTHLVSTETLARWQATALGRP